jgi:hypothetical protein
MVSPVAEPKEPIACPLSALATVATMKDPTSKQSPRRRQTNTSDDNPNKRPRRRKTSTERPSFPSILMGMLLNPQYADTIAFLSDERRFIIVNPIELETKVLPLYRDELGGVATYESFIVMLRNWGFQINNDAEKYPDINVYSHDKFKKGDWESCLQIQLVGQPSPLPAPTHCNPSEVSLLRRMEASSATRRLSGVGLNGDHVAMRSFLQNQMAFRRMSLPTPLPQSMLPQGVNGQDKKVGENADDVKGEKENGSNDDAKKKEIASDTVSMADKIVKDAMAALTNQQPTKPLHRRHSMEEINAMTEEFLRRSMSRRFGSRPLFSPGIMYSNMVKNDQLMAEVGAKVDAQAKVLYAQRRRASLASQNMENGGEKDDRESSKGEVAPSGKDKCEDEEKVKTDESEDEKESLESDSKEGSDV